MVKLISCLLRYSETISIKRLSLYASCTALRLSHNIQPRVLSAGIPADAFPDFLAVGLQIIQIYALSGAEKDIRNCLVAEVLPNPVHVVPDAFAASNNPLNGVPFARNITCNC